MLTRHFLKTLMLFFIMIVIALIGVFWVGTLEDGDVEILNTGTQ